MRPRIRKTLFAFLSAAIIGVATGVLTPSNVQSSHQRELWVYPGDQSNDWAYMTCGWHTICPSGPGGNGLDWGNQATWPVIWRDWAYRPASYAYFGTGAPATDNGACKAVRVSFYDENGQSRGYVRYVHSEFPGGQFYISAGPQWEAHAFVVASTAQNDLPACPTSGPHLHQEVGSGWTKDSGYPNAPATGWYQVWVDWMHYRLW